MRRIRPHAIAIMLGAAAVTASCAPAAPVASTSAAATALATTVAPPAPTTALAAPTAALSPRPAIVWAPRAAVTCTETAGELVYESDGKTVRGALAKPSGSGPWPAALVLHTRGGLNSHVRSEAAWLAAQGILAFAPDYLTPVGVTPQTFDPSTFFAQHTDDVRAHLAHGVDCLRLRSDVRPDRVGVVGFSLGGYFSVLLATREGTASAVSWYGALVLGGIATRASRYQVGEVVTSLRTPLLLLHGDQDTEAPAGLSHRMQTETEHGGKVSELVIYPGVGHGWDQQGTTYVYDAKATDDARARTLALFRETMR